jgi:hypothetical protein
VIKTFFPKIIRLRDNVEKYGTAGQATDDNTLRCMRIACWLPKATDTHSEYVILIITYPWYDTKAPQCYFIRALPVLFLL